VKIGITCYPTYGGSGAVATELGIALAGRGHEIHFITYRQPFRLPAFLPNVFFHEVDVGRYPLFEFPPYDLALAVRMHEVVMTHGLEILHCHYAIPHATSAWIAREMLRQTHNDVKVITTLHGTDITLVGSDPSYAETVAFCIDQSDHVTAVSESLRTDTCRRLGITRHIQVIPNFLDGDRFARRTVPAPTDPRPRVVHISNFRPVKRIDALIDVFERIRAALPSVLVLVGEGPELETARQRVKAAGLEADVEYAGENKDVVDVLSRAQLFLLPSATESFGLAALEAMACEVPVVASRVGGVPEVIDDGVTGFLRAPDDVDGMAEAGIRLLTDPALHERIRLAARDAAVRRFSASRVVPIYEAAYERMAMQGAQAPV